MSLATKLLEVQQELTGKLVFDARNDHFKNSYITLGKLLEEVLPSLQSRGVLLTQFLTGDNALGNIPAISTSFIDTETGETLAATVPLVLEKETPQGVGSAITYTRRYAILSALGLCADADDDAEGATGPRHEPAYRPGDYIPASF